MLRMSEQRAAGHTYATQLRIPEITLARRLYLARDEAGLTQKELAERIDVSKRSVVNYEGGETAPRRHVVVAWALATGVPAEYLLDGRDDMIPAKPQAAGRQLAFWPWRVRDSVMS